MRKHFKPLALLMMASISCQVGSKTVFAQQIVPAPQTETVQVRVDVQKSYVINGHTEIQSNVLGVTAYAGAVLPATLRGQETLRQINLPLIGLPANINWCAPPEKPADGAAGIARWYASDEARKLIRDRPLISDRYMLGRILPAARQMGIEPMVYLLNGPDWAMGPEKIPLDDETYAALAVGYVGLLKEFDPQLRLIHIGNEPNAHYFKVKKYGKEYGQTFVAVARALKKKFPDLQIGGPVLLWPPSWPKKPANGSNWYTWDEWTKPFLDVAGNDLDFFDYHQYDMKQREDRSEFLNDATEEIQLISNELWQRRGKRIPIYLSEWGVALHDNEWRDTATHWRWRTIPSAHFLLDRLEEPDKVASAQQHDLSAMVAPDQSFGITDANNSEQQSPTYWLYWLLRHTRGMRLMVSSTPAESQDLRIFATRQTPVNQNVEPQASVVLLNDSDKNREVKVDFNGLPNWLKKPQWERLYVDSGKLVRDAGMSEAIVLPPRSMAVATVILPRQTSLTTGGERLDFYGQKVLQEWKKVGEELTIPVTVPADALRGATTARVRIGLQNAAGKDQVTLKLGDHVYTLKNDVYVQEIPLKALPVAGDNTLSFKLEARDGDHRIRVSTVSIVLEKRTP